MLEAFANIPIILLKTYDINSYFDMNRNSYSLWYDKTEKVTKHKIFQHYPF